MSRKLMFAIAALCFAAGGPAWAAEAVNPGADFKAFRDFFTSRFPKVPLNDFVNGPYSMDADLRKQWEAKEEFPPYEFALDQGKEMF
ncbi:MAG TPA: sulfur oxidation c-type cytochrome SoxA, partial [Xanthobacteraceae bacterium]|nr:sulfur oxidation c-type cytochrome SoxA [Xanthobacteraceae bacterium]